MIIGMNTDNLGVIPALLNSRNVAYWCSIIINKILMQVLLAQIA